MKVLVIDDDPNIIEMVKVNLELDGIKVISAANGKDGLEMAKTHKPDLILMDWMLPKMSGIDAVKLIRKDPSIKDIPIFMLTARSQVTDIDQAFKVGADSYITKPFNPVNLASLLQSKLSKIERD
ncbi:MAG: response regulator [Spirochaetes bacterium]|nr:response regulator [Spirochaetota bacterium]